jgi:16S rRNA (cytidine1402-2'-O)-methyltransferase
MSAPNPKTAGRLFIVGTPIGCLEDISARALRVLREAAWIAAEDTRHTLKLLTHFKIRTPLISYYREIEKERALDLVRRLRAGADIALVSDAGMPLISDPGRLLVQSAREAGIAIEIIPGPSAVMCALAGAGMDGEQFTFHGFLPEKSGARRKHLLSMRDRPEVQVMYVAPHKLETALEDLLALWGDREAVLCREMTKIHEEYDQKKLSKHLEALKKKPPKGEYTIVLAGQTEARLPKGQETLEEKIKRLRESGLTQNQAIAQAARELGIARQDVYRMAHGMKRHEDCLS